MCAPSCPRRGRLIRVLDGYRTTMHFKDEAALCIDAYEAGIRAATDV